MSQPEERNPTHSQKFEALGQLAGGVAHDFNNLLTVIIGGLDLILKDPTDTERVKRLAAAALAAGRRGESLTRQLLAFSRRQALPMGRVDVVALIKQIEPLVRSFLGETIAFRVAFEPETELCWLDPAQFESALINLLVNAKDAVTEYGEISLSVRSKTIRQDEMPHLVDGPSFGIIDLTLCGDTLHRLEHDRFLRLAQMEGFSA